MRHKCEVEVAQKTHKLFAAVCLLIYISGNGVEHQQSYCTSSPANTISLVVEIDFGLKHVVQFDKNAQTSNRT